MSAPLPPARPRDHATVVLLGLALVLATMAAVVVVGGLLVHRSATDVCSSPGTSVGECLLATRAGQEQLRMIWLAGLTLGAGAVAAGLAAAVASTRR